MPTAKDDTWSLLDLRTADSENSSCYSEDSQPRICFDEYCTFPIGDNMCTACRLDRAIRKKTVSKTAKLQLAKDWVEEVNVQKFVTNYSGEVFIGGATDRDAFVEEKPDGIVEIEEDQREANEYGELDEEDSPDLSHLVPTSFTSVWDISPNRLSTVEETPSPTETSSNLSVRSDLSAFLEPWMSDLFDRTLDGQMEETTFIGGAEEDPFEALCTLCRSPVGDPIYQHVLRCQYAHDEQERMEALWTR